MPNDFIDSYVVYGFISVLAFIIMLVSIDRYLTRRRSTALNANYLAKMQSQARDFGTFQSHSRTTRLPFDAALAELPWELEAVHDTSTSRSRTRVLRDRLGRTVATHYEEIVAGDFSRAQHLRYLPAARA